MPGCVHGWGASKAVSGGDERHCESASVFEGAGKAGRGDGVEDQGQDWVVCADRIRSGDDPGEGRGRGCAESMGGGRGQSRSSAVFSWRYPVLTCRLAFSGRSCERDGDGTRGDACAGGSIAAIIVGAFATRMCKRFRTDTSCDAARQPPKPRERSTTSSRATTAR
eukprot:2077437-Rhodomonas_salina.1